MSTRRLLLSIVVLLGLLYFGGLAPYGLQPAEDGDVLYQSYATYRGQLPYVDFSTGYTPAYFYWHALLFHVFGVDVLVTRFSLAAANIATLVLIFALTARLTSPGWGALAAFLFAASLPLFPGDFCSFNVPYPAWYGITLWLGSIAAVIAYVERGRLLWLVAAAALAGLGFSVKPNVGLFNLVALSLFILWWHAPAPKESARARVLWWVLAVGTLLGVVAVFQTQLLRRAVLLFPLPVLAIAGVLLAQARRHPGVPGFLRALAALAGGFALPTLPWIAFFLVKLGIGRFLREVLLLGSSYERFFLIPHRALWTPYDILLAGALVALVATPIAVHRRLVRPMVPLALAVAAAAAATTFIVFFAPMPSGFQSSVTTRVQDLTFFVLQVVNWAGIVVVARSTAGGRRDATTAALVVLAVSGPAFTLAMYPRSDFMHLLGSAPTALILGIVMLARVAARWRDAYPPAPFWRYATTALIVVPFVAIAAIMMAPGIALTTDVYRYYAGNDDQLEALAMKRATLVMHRNHRLVGPLRDVAAYIDRTTLPEDRVFPFPNLHLVCFLGGRLNSTSKGYFIAGYPDHASEAAIVSDLRARPPRLVVALHDNELFVTTAPLYYFLIRDHVRTRFEPVARIGPYIVLNRNDEALPTPPALAFTPDAKAAPADTWPGLASPDLAVQWQTAMALRRERDPRAAIALAERAAAPDSPYPRLFIQIAAEFGDERAMPPLIEVVRRDLEAPRESWQSGGVLRTPEGLLAARTLFWIAERSVLAEFWFVNEDAEERLASARARLQSAPVLAWLQSPDLDPHLRYVAAWLAGTVREQAAVPYLLTMLGERDQNLTFTAAHALAKLGQVEGTTEMLVSLLEEEAIYSPSVLLELHAVAPERVRPLLVRALREGTSEQREAVSWIAAAAHDPALLETVASMRDDADLAVRRAALAALALADPTTGLPSVDVATPGGVGG